MSVLNRQWNITLGHALRCGFDLANEIFHSRMEIDASGGAGMRAPVDKESAATERPGPRHDVDSQSIIPQAAREARLYQRFFHIWEG
ncbi:hypothetical protein [Burkholderia ambifaria]|jgi:hypothetical protein|uniref:hypothetical protein n=1 Tax=Burkholderia ambifaria TaxID=152480 RepID=UPI00130D8D27|nr:hypothetical protein [Burkholderia ambifaria]MBR7931847.1 hypothetical protein [Burkholderia ambifaria]QQC07000.1 hypothetical protein I6H84_27800 [Burkholderia ambifaria]UZU01695.1 hypothetical protein OR987_13355 [Burkholderia ambifaria]UZU08246.1 hypothetical protein OR988_13355 [Burkholderia ambifaria]WDS13508.1 hypothetical protein OR984_08905 [Burkholderia ambifaria]